MPCFTYKQALLIYFHSIVMYLDTLSFTDAELTRRILPRELTKYFVMKPLWLATVTLLTYAARAAHRRAAASYPSIPKLLFYAPTFFIAMAVDLILVELAGSAKWQPVDNWLLMLPWLLLTALVYRWPLSVLSYKRLGAAAFAAAAYLVNTKVLGGAGDAHWGFVLLSTTSAAALISLLL